MCRWFQPQNCRCRYKRLCVWLLKFDLEKKIYLALKNTVFQVIKQTSDDSKNTANAVKMPWNWWVNGPSEKNSNNQINSNLIYASIFSSASEEKYKTNLMERKNVFQKPTADNWLISTTSNKTQWWSCRSLTWGIIIQDLSPAEREGCFCLSHPKVHCNEEVAHLSRTLIQNAYHYSY